MSLKPTSATVGPMCDPASGPGSTEPMSVDPGAIEPGLTGNPAAGNPAHATADIMCGPTGTRLTAPVDNRRSSPDAPLNPFGGVNVRLVAPRRPPGPEPRTPVDPDRLENASTAKPRDRHQSAIFPAHVTNSPTSHDPVFVLVGGGRGWLRLEPGQSTHPDLDIDGVLHAGGFRKIGDGSNMLVVDGDLRTVNGAIFSFSGYGDWRPGAPAKDSEGRTIVAPGEIMDGRRDAFGFDSFFTRPAR